MDFGKVPEADLNNIDFTLPPDPVDNDSVLDGKRSSNPKVYVGCAKWGRKEWLGRLYPENTKDAAYLEEYVKHYNAIELNATHYKTYPPEVIAKWAQKAAGRDFMFCPKVVKSISHYGAFVKPGDKTNNYLRGIVAFAENLGPVFLQVSDRFTPNSKANFFKYIEELPHDIRFFVEVRNQRWFSETEILKELVRHLRDTNTGFVITDTAGRRDCVHLQLTTKTAFIRFVGNNLHATDYTRIDAWANRISEWLNKGLQEVYFFMHMPDEKFSPELSVYLVEKLNLVCNLHIPVPRLLTKNQKTLIKARTPRANKTALSDTTKKVPCKQSGEPT